jgi:hypothetical protein
MAATGRVVARQVRAQEPLRDVDHLPLVGGLGHRLLWNIGPEHFAGGD